MLYLYLTIGWFATSIWYFCHYKEDWKVAPEGFTMNMVEWILFPPLLVVTLIIAIFSKDQ